MNRKVTITDVARAAGVSPSTASVVFSGKVNVSEETMAKVRKAADDLGYLGPDPRAASLRTGRSGIVGVVMGASLRTAFLDPVAIATMDGIASAVAHIGAGILLLRTDGGTPAATEVPLDAVVIFYPHAGHTDLIEQLQSRDIPIVQVEGDTHPDVPLVSLDSREAQAEIAHHVRGLGHTDVIAVTLPWGEERTVGLRDHNEVPRIEVTRERLAGVRDVFPDALAFSAAASSVDDGIAVAREIFAHHIPTAILAQSDMLAAGIIRAAHERGIMVPEQLSVTGFDGIIVDGLAPIELTTTQQPAYEKGRAAGDAVSRLLQGEQAASIRFTCTFRLGNTTAPATPFSVYSDGRRDSNR